MTVLIRSEIEEEIRSGNIRFDPPLQERQWGDVCINLRLGYKFTQLRSSSAEITLAEGIIGISELGLWHEKTYPHIDDFGKDKDLLLSRMSSYLLKRSNMFTFQPT